MNELNKLIENFLQKYTFNNLEVLLNDGEELSLDDGYIEDKIIVKSRGGYCFENNQYFYNFLKDKSFDVKRILARVVYGNESSNIPRTHQFTLVNLDGEKFVADVGFGPYTPGAAIPFTGEAVKAFNGNEYRVIAINNVDYQLQVIRDGEFFSLHEFNLSEYNQADFRLSNYYTSTHPKSKFRTSLIISKLTSKGVRFINNLSFAIFEDGIRTDLVMNSFEEFNQVIRENFDVGYSEQELLRIFEKVKGFVE